MEGARPAAPAASAPAEGGPAGGGPVGGGPAGGGPAGGGPAGGGPGLARLPGAASLTDQVAASVRAGVRSGALRAGELYSAYQLAEMLGVSRSPVREALMRLAEAGLVALERNRGFRIVVPDARDIAEIFHLRRLVEVEAARRAATAPGPVLVRGLRAALARMDAAAEARDEREFMHHDQRLHSLILDHAGNRRGRRLIDSLRDATRLLGASTAGTSRSLHDIAAEHAPVVDAVEAADPDAAAAAMAAHVENTARLLLAQALDVPPDDGRVLALWSEVAG